MSQLVYEGPDLQQLVRRVLDDHGPAQLRPPERKRKGGLFGFFQREVYVLTVDPEATGTSPSDPLGAYVEGMDDVLDLGSSTLPKTPPSFDKVLAEVASTLGEEPGAYRLSKPAEPVHQPSIGISRETIAELLRASGLPRHLIPEEAELAGGEAGLVSALAGLPEPPPLPRCAGALVAVVGPVPTATRTLASLIEGAECVRPATRIVCQWLEVEAEPMVVCERPAKSATMCGRRAHSASEAAALAPGWRRDRVGVVAVYGKALGADQQWTRSVLRAMLPSWTMGVVPATTKPEDIHRWVRDIGGVDALALTGVRATTTPASVLSLGIPVAMLDEQAATAAAWADVISGLAV